MTLVEKSRWHDFAGSFTRAHDGWGATLQSRADAEPLRVVVDDFPFRGMTVEERHDRETLILTFGDDADEHFTQIVDAPVQLQAAESGDRSDATLIVRDAGGATLVLLLSNPLQETE